MFKEIGSGFSKFFTREKVIALVALFVLGFGLFSYSGAKGVLVDRYENGPGNVVATPPPAAVVPTPPASSGSQAASEYTLQPVANPSDLLPQDKNSEWTSLNPVSRDNMAMPDLLQAGHHMQMDTIGQTLRNANLQLRSDPIIPKMDTGPWMQSTIEPDLGRVPLELGYGCK